MLVSLVEKLGHRGWATPWAEKRSHPTLVLFHVLVVKALYFKTEPYRSGLLISKTQNTVPSVYLLNVTYFSILNATWDQS
jgi:hypothetical protein